MKTVFKANTLITLLPAERRVLMTAQRDEEQPPQPRHSPATNKQDVCVSSTNTDLFSLSLPSVCEVELKTRVHLSGSMCSHMHSPCSLLLAQTVFMCHTYIQRSSHDICVLTKKPLRLRQTALRHSKAEHVLRLYRLCILCCCPTSAARSPTKIN